MGSLCELVLFFPFYVCLWANLPLLFAHKLFTLVRLINVVVRPSSPNSLEFTQTPFFLLLISSFLAVGQLIFSECSLAHADFQILMVLSAQPVMRQSWPRTTWP